MYLENSPEHMKNDWWHIIIGTPIVFPLAGILGSIGVIILIPMVLLFPIAIYYDSRYVRAANETWQPSRGYAAVLGIAVLLTFGLLSYIISPYYLYKRHNHVGSP